MHPISTSSFQELSLVETPFLGRALMLDGLIQSAEGDEHLYHESLVHPALLASASSPHRIFVGGGGEGATLRELLKHRDVEHVIMADIDGDCVLWCREILTHHHRGSMNDPRVHIVHQDAARVLAHEPDGGLDVIVLDLADPTADGPCGHCYTEEFYQLCQKKMSPSGVLVTQSGPGGLFSAGEVFGRVHATLTSVFGSVFAWSVHVPSFGDLYTFCGATNSGEIDLRKWSASDVDEMLKERLVPGSDKLRHYDGESHVSAVHLPKHMREIARRGLKSTGSNPAKMSVDTKANEGE